MDGKTSDFKKEISGQAQKFNYFSMSYEDAIARLLVEEGMKPEISQNADAKKAIVDLIKTNLSFPETINQGNIDSIRYRLKNYIDPETKTIKRKITSTDYLTATTTTTTIIIDVKNGKMVKSEGAVGKSFYNHFDYHNKVETTFEDGIEMKVIEENSEGNIFTYTRNEDLVSAYVTFENKFKQNSTRGGNVFAGPVKIGGTRYFDFDKIVSAMDDARKNGKTPEGFIYEGKDPIEIKKLEVQKKQILKSYCESSEEFKKLAIKKGLVKDIGEPTN